LKQEIINGIFTGKIISDMVQFNSDIIKGKLKKVFPDLIEIDSLFQLVDSKSELSLMGRGLNKRDEAVSADLILDRGGKIKEKFVEAIR
jgi:hypothetical protein